MSRLKVVDNLDDRREVWRALHHLEPMDRVAVLAAICRSAWTEVYRPYPAARVWEDARRAERSDEYSRRLTNEVFNDLWLLVSQYGLDAERVAVTVVSYARRPDRIPAAAIPASASFAARCSSSPSAPATVHTSYTSGTAPRGSPSSD